jgi:tight adherence protein C
MTKTQYLLLFYGISAVVVGVLFFRMWRKSRAAGAPPAPPKPARPVARATGSPTPRPATPMVVAPPPLATPQVVAPVVTAVAQTAVAAVSPPPIPELVDTPLRAPMGPMYRTTSAETSTNLFAGIGRTDASLNADKSPLHGVSTTLDRADDYAYGSATPLLASLLPESDERRRETVKELQSAGYYEPHAAENLAATRYLFLIIPIVLLGITLLFAPPAAELYILGAMLLLPLLGWAFPRLVVKSQAKERLFQIERAMPDMLDMLSMCVSQGMTLPSALGRVTEELNGVHPALHKELAIVTDQAQVGGMRQALENFSRRIELPEVQSFTSLLIQTERMGTSVSTALMEYSDNIRSSLKQRADEKGNQAAFKLLFPTVLCLMPAVYLFLLGPSILELADFVNRDNSTLREANVLIRRTGTNNANPR